MLSTAIPAKIELPWAASGDKVVVPVPSQIPVTDGRASYTTGFPPLNGTPLDAGGVAPFQTDFNGVLNQITAVQQWQCAGGIFRYDAAFSTAIGGYPKCAILQGATGVLYQNTLENNSTNPESGNVGWGPLLGATPSVGDRSNKLATTSMFGTEFPSVLSGNGYKKIPDPTAPGGYLILQWGSLTVTGGIAAASPFVIAFPNGVLYAGAAWRVAAFDGGSSAKGSFGVSTSTTQITISPTDASGTFSVNWLAIGS